MRFIVFGDSKGKEDGINKKILHSLLKESRKLIPSADFIVILGDSIAGSTDSNTFLTQVNNFRNIVSSYYENIPLLPIIGNHEENACSENNKRKLVFVHSPAFPTGAHFGHCLDLYPECRNSFW